VRRLSHESVQLERGAHQDRKEKRRVIFEEFESGTFVNGECLEVMRSIPDGYFDMILCDLPYGTTKNKWDSMIDLRHLWAEYKRLIKNNSAIVLTSQIPFSVTLSFSNLEMLKYEWIWEKESGSGHLNSRFAPLKSHENILVFSHGSSCHVTDTSSAMPYYPQMEKGSPYKQKSGKASTNYDHKNCKTVETTNSGNRFPKTVLRFDRDKNKIHPTQKPVELFEYLIRTYTNEGQRVLDNTAGSGTTAIAAIRSNRKWVCIEQSEEYYAKAIERIKTEKRSAE
jgi:site-specific DNA-methyltransferase (adenine-specific)